MRTYKLFLLLALALAFALSGCKDKPKPKKTPAKKEQVEEGKETPEPEAGEEEGEEEEGDKAVAEDDEAEGEEEAAADDKPVQEEKPADEGAPEAADDELISTIVATVNGKDIDAADYVERLKRLTKGKVTKSLLKKTVIDRMINDELLRQEIDKLSIVVSDEEIAEAMNMDMERYIKQKETMGARVNAFKERVAVRKLLQARGLLKEPTDEELLKEYERRFGLKLDAVTIPVAPTATPELEEAAKAQADKVLAAVNGGLTLREAVKDQKDPNGRRIIVKPTFIKKGDERQKELWAVANPLKEKDLGGPVKTRQGYVVFMLAKRIQPKKPFEEMKVKLKKSAMNMKTAQAKHRLLEDLRNAAKVEYLIEFPKQDRMNRPRLRGGRMPPGVRPGAAGKLRMPPRGVGPARKGTGGAAAVPANRPAPATAPTEAPAN
jgi:hypothetical protein